MTVSEAPATAGEVVLWSVPPAPPPTAVVSRGGAAGTAPPAETTG